MDLWNIVKTVGSAVVAHVVPGGAAIVAAVNALLPDNEKLPSYATGHQMDKAIAGLSAEQKIALLSKQYDVDIAAIQQGNQTLRTMLETEQKSPHSTRPKIAFGCFLVLAFITVCVGVSIVWCVVKADHTTLGAMKELTMLLGGVTAIFALVLRAYFGILSHESRDRQNAANGFQNIGALAAVTSKVIGR